MEIYTRQIGKTAIRNQQSAILSWLILAAGALLVFGLIVAAPVAFANNHEFIALTIYASFSKVCHQLSERSFYIAGHPFAVCSRCTGLYAGFAVALLFYPLMTSLKRTYAPLRKWLFLAAVPMAIDVGLHALGIWQNTHSSRFFTGALLGAVSVFYVMPGVVDLASRRWRSTSTTQSGIPLTTTCVSTANIAAAPSDYSAPHRRI
ncbi:MAG TPA: DUF2085 domain-containing protein [Pyrinomonadaceae bacterium]|nr:DUF2085 domain-containing protein [Pyrinomonadaceae bacterium]